MNETAPRPLSIVAMRDKHLEALARLEQLCFSIPWSYESLEQELANEQAAVFVAEWQGNTAGYAGLHFVLDEAYVTNIAVFPAYRHRGIGRALIREQKRFCRRRGFAMLTLEVRASNATAIGLYESEGFLIQGRRKDFYQLPTEDALIMTCFFQPKGRGPAEKEGTPHAHSGH